MEIEMSDSTLFRTVNLSEINTLRMYSFVQKQHVTLSLNLAVARISHFEHGHNSSVYTASSSSPFST